MAYTGVASSGSAVDVNRSETLVPYLLLLCLQGYVGVLVYARHVSRHRFDDVWPSKAMYRSKPIARSRDEACPCGIVRNLTHFGRVLVPLRHGSFVACGLKTAQPLSERGVNTRAVAASRSLQIRPDRYIGWTRVFLRPPDTILLDRDNYCILKGEGGNRAFKKERGAKHISITCIVCDATMPHQELDRYSVTQPGWWSRDFKEGTIALKKVRRVL